MPSQDKDICESIPMDAKTRKDKTLDSLTKNVPDVKIATDSEEHSAESTPPSSLVVDHQRPRQVALTSSTPTPTVFNTFHSFRKLSEENRTMIWKMALFGRRFVSLRFVDDTTNLNVEDRLTLWNAPSPLFYVNRESRHVALTKYSIKLSNSSVNDCRSRIDPDEDVVLIQYYHTEGDWYSTALFELQRYWSQEAVEKIKYIALDSRIITMGLMSPTLITEEKRDKIEDFEVRKLTFYLALMKFQALKSISIIYHHRFCITTPTSTMWDTSVILVAANGREEVINHFRQRINFDIEQASLQAVSNAKWASIPKIRFGLLKVEDQKCCKVVGDRQDTALAFADELLGDDLTWSGDERMRKGKKEYVAPKELRQRKEIPRFT